ncbi:hypothetical protein CPLU01_15380 [Colletotrichum plurivorum]|uniref:BTB domain-containing protein n=1 Tax=Colletotrichum plurivorum TaxID=2175906 RepID=A0A8H6MVY6_9PEZI|nr:hypothetical protein CPLU01_15380 [Colletotrichum plurivorum]
MTDVVAYDPDGDLILRVGPDLSTSKYQVCSKTLSRSSVVFKRMLYGPFLESLPTDGSEWTVQLPDDDAAAMAVFLSIIHGMFHLTPNTLTLKELYNLLILTEKYDATDRLRPWAASWLEAVKDQREGPWLLGIAWELGAIELFQSMMVRIAENSHEESPTVGGGNTETTLLYGGGGGESRLSTKDVLTLRVGPPTWPITIMESLTPTGMLETLRANRRALLSAEVQPYLSLYDDVLKFRCNFGGYGRVMNPEAAWQCDCMVLGSLEKGFRKHDIELIRSSFGFATYYGSVAHIRKALADLKIYSPHHECSDEIEKRLQKARKAAVAVKDAVHRILPNHLSHLNKQAEKMGFPVRK